MFKITIVSLFCDKDYHLIDQLIKELEENIHCSYNIVLIDNTSPEVHETLSELYKKYPFIYRHPSNRNVRQLMARLYALQFVTGEYTWFVDIDDHPLSIDESTLTDNDITIYSAISDADEHTMRITDKFVSLENGLYPNLLINTLLALWNKIFKTEMLKEAVKVIPDNLEISTYEDTIIYLAALKYTKCFQYKNTCIYHKVVGISDNKYISEEYIDYICMGVKDADTVIRSLLTEQELSGNFLGGDPYQAACQWIVDRIKANGNKKELYQYIQKYFSKESILKAVKHTVSLSLPSYLAEYEWRPEFNEFIERQVNKIRSYLC